MSSPDTTRDPEGSGGNITAALYMIGGTFIALGFGVTVVSDLDPWRPATFGAILVAAGAVRGAIEARR